MPVAIGIAGLAVSAYGAKKQSDAAKGAAAAQGRAGQASIAEQRAVRDQYLQPYAQAGQGALGTMQNLLAGDFSSFRDSPYYQFTLDQGLNALQRSQAARGVVNSGGASVDVLRYGQGLASQRYGDYWNRLSQMAQMGQTAGANAMGVSNQISNALTGIGQAQAQGIYGQNAATQNLLGNLTGVASAYMAARPPANPNSYANNPTYLSPVTRQPLDPGFGSGYGG